MNKDNFDSIGSLFLNKTKKDGSACRPFIRGDLTIDGKVVSVIGSLVERPAKAGGNVQYFLMSEQKAMPTTPQAKKTAIKKATGTEISDILGV